MPHWRLRHASSRRRVAVDQLEAGLRNLPPLISRGIPFSHRRFLMKPPAKHCPDWRTVNCADNGDAPGRCRWIDFACRARVAADDRRACRGIRKRLMIASRRDRICLAWLVALEAIALGGCSSGRLMNPTAIPTEFLVSHVENAQTVDLSKLATSSASNELIDCGDLLTVTIQSGFQGSDPGCKSRSRWRRRNAMVPLIGGVDLGGNGIDRSRAGDSHGRHRARRVSQSQRHGRDETATHQPRLPC